MVTSIQFDPSGERLLVDRDGRAELLDLDGNLDADRPGLGAARRGRRATIGPSAPRWSHRIRSRSAAAIRIA